MTTEDRLVEVTSALENVLENVEITPDGVYAESQVYDWMTEKDTVALVKLADPLADMLLAADELLNRLGDDSSFDADTEVDLNDEE